MREPGPDLGRLRRLPQLLDVLLAERLEHDDRSLEAVGQVLHGGHSGKAPAGQSAQAEDEPLVAAVVGLVALGHALDSRAIRRGGGQPSGSGGSRARSRSSRPLSRVRGSGRRAPRRSRGAVPKRRRPGATAPPPPACATARPGAPGASERDDSDHRASRSATKTWPRSSGLEELGLRVGHGPPALAFADVGRGPETGDRARRLPARLADERPRSQLFANQAQADVELGLRAEVAVPLVPGAALEVGAQALLSPARSPRREPVPERAAAAGRRGRGSSSGRSQRALVNSSRQRLGAGTVSIVAPGRLASSAVDRGHQLPLQRHRLGEVLGEGPDSPSSSRRRSSAARSGAGRRAASRRGRRRGPASGGSSARPSPRRRSCPRAAGLRRRPRARARPPVGRWAIITGEGSTAMTSRSVGS